MKRSTVTATIIIALVALIIFAGVSNVQQTAASSGQCNATTQHTTHTRHNTPDNNVLGYDCNHPPGCGCYHHYLRHCSTTSEV